MVWYSDHWLAFLMYVPAALAGLLATQVGGPLTYRTPGAQSLHCCIRHPTLSQAIVMLLLCRQQGAKCCVWTSAMHCWAWHW